MKLREVQRLLDARVLCGSQLLEKEVLYCCGCDLMSDVLAFVKKQALLCTGLTNIQVVRTADITELGAVVFVRGKLPNASALEEAEAGGLPLLATELTLFEACGILYGAGLMGCGKKDKNER